MEEPDSIAAKEWKKRDSRAMDRIEIDPGITIKYYNKRASNKSCNRSE